MSPAVPIAGEEEGVGSMQDVTGVHLVVGGYPPGAPAGHDMDFVRLRLLDLLSEQEIVHSTVSNDFVDLDRWLDRTRLLVSYVAGPYPDDVQNRALRSWLEGGGRWLALHGTSGGRAARVPAEGGRARRMMVKGDHHETLGCFFLNHPPLRRFRLAVKAGHPLTVGLPDSFEVHDELYLLEILAPGTTDVALTTELEVDPSPPDFGFAYERDTSLQADGRTRVIAYTRDVGEGAVAYVALGHCHSPTSNSQPFVDATVAADGRTPLTFRGPWDDPTYLQLLRNGLRWGTGRP
jgi:hypothetical protein